MFQANSFFDYNVPEKCLENSNYEKVIKLMYNFGYRTIAINQTVNENDLGPSSKKKKKGKGDAQTSDPVPLPYKIITVKGCEKMKILNRLTIQFSTADVMHKITKSPNFKQYHIVAVMPETSSAFVSVASNFDFDILTFNSENKHKFKINRKILNQFIERRVHIEIPYGPAIEDSSRRKHIIHLAHTYHELVKSRRIIISSAANNPMHIRNPYDIIFLGIIFGLNEQQAKDAVTHCGRQVFINSVGRRHGKAVMFVEKVQKTPEKSVIEISESDSDELMEVEEPLTKKTRTSDFISL